MIYRHLIEMSSIMNNDVYIIYNIKPLTGKLWEDYKKEIKKTRYVEPQRMLYRPVYPEENIKNTNTISKFDEKVEEITLLFDSLYKIKEFLSSMIKVKNKNINDKLSNNSFYLAMFIGTAYYDCMSGGMNLYDMVILKYLVSQPEINKNENVYPGKDKWFTIQDWLEEENVKNIPDFIDLINKYRSKINFAKLLEYKE